MAFIVARDAEFGIPNSIRILCSCYVILSRVCDQEELKWPWMLLSAAARTQVIAVRSLLLFPLLFALHGEGDFETSLPRLLSVAQTESRANP